MTYYRSNAKGKKQTSSSSKSKKKTTRKISTPKAPFFARKEGVTKSFNFEVVKEEDYNPFQRVQKGAKRLVVLNMWDYQDISVYMEEYAKSIPDPKFRSNMLRVVEKWCSKEDIQRRLKNLPRDYITTFGEEEFDIEGESIPFYGFGSGLLIKDGSYKGSDSNLRILIVCQSDIVVKEDEDGEWGLHVEDGEDLDSDQFTFLQRENLKRLESTLKKAVPKQGAPKNIYFGRRNFRPRIWDDTQGLTFQQNTSQKVINILIAAHPQSSVDVINLWFDNALTHFAGKPIIRERMLLREGVQGSYGDLSNFYVAGDLNLDTARFPKTIRKNNPEDDMDLRIAYDIQEQILTPFAGQATRLYIVPTYPAVTRKMEGAHEVAAEMAEEYGGDAGVSAATLDQGSNVKVGFMYALKSDKIEERYGGKTVKIGAQLAAGAQTVPVKRLPPSFSLRKGLGKAKFTFDTVKGIYKNTASSFAVQSSAAFQGKALLPYTLKKKLDQPTIVPLRYYGKPYLTTVARMAAIVDIKPAIRYLDSPKFNGVPLQSQYQFELIRDGFKHIVRYLDEEGFAERPVIVMDWNDLDLPKGQYFTTDYTNKPLRLEPVEALIHLVRTIFLNQAIKVFLYNVPSAYLRYERMDEIKESYQIQQRQLAKDQRVATYTPTTVNGVAGYLGVLGRGKFAQPFVIGAFPSVWNEKRFKSTALYKAMVIDGIIQRLVLRKSVQGIPKGRLFKNIPLAIGHVKNVLREYVINNSNILKNLKMIDDSSSYFEDGLDDWAIYFSRLRRYKMLTDNTKGIQAEQAYLEKHLERYTEYLSNVETYIKDKYEWHLNKQDGNLPNKYSDYEQWGIEAGRISANALDGSPKYRIKMYEQKAVHFESIKSFLDKKIIEINEISSTDPFAEQIEGNIVNLGQRIQDELSRLPELINQAQKAEKTLRRKKSQVKEGAEAVKPTRPSGEPPFILLYGMNNDGSFFKVNLESVTTDSGRHYPYYFPTDPFSPLNVAFNTVLENSTPEVNVMRLARDYGSKSEVAQLDKAEGAKARDQAYGILAKVAKRFGKGEAAATIAKGKGDNWNAKQKANRVIRGIFGTGNLTGDIGNELEYLKKLRKKLRKIGKMEYVPTPNSQPPTGTWYVTYKNQKLTLNRYKELRFRRAVEKQRIIHTENKTEVEDALWDCIVQPSMEEFNVAGMEDSYNTIIEEQLSSNLTRSYSPQEEAEAEGLTNREKKQEKKDQRKRRSQLKRKEEENTKNLLKIQKIVCKQVMVNFGKTQNIDQYDRFLLLFNQFILLTSSSWNVTWYKGKKEPLPHFMVDSMRSWGYKEYIKDKFKIDSLAKLSRQYSEAVGKEVQLYGGTKINAILDNMPPLTSLSLGGQQALIDVLSKILTTVSREIRSTPQKRAFAPKIRELSNAVSSAVYTVFGEKPTMVEYIWKQRGQNVHLEKVLEYMMREKQDATTSSELLLAYKVPLKELVSINMANQENVSAVDTLVLALTVVNGRLRQPYRDIICKDV